MPPPGGGKEGTEEGIRVSWEDILAQWDVVYADLLAVYGMVVETVRDWPNFRRLILGLMGRKESVFSVTKALEYQARTERKPEV